MTSTKQVAPASRTPKWPVAFLVVAVVLALGSFAESSLRSSGSGEGAAQPSPLPDPQHMALLATDRSTPADIVDVWQAQLGQQPMSAALHTKLAGAQLRLAAATGDLRLYEQAEDVAAAAVDLAPDDDSARLVLASAKSGQHDFVGALAIAEAVLENQPGSVPALLAVTDALIELGDYEAAERTLNRASFEIGGRPPALLSRFGRLAAITGDSAESLRLARLALVGAADIDLPLADAAFYWLQLAHYEFQSGNALDALDLAETALLIDPANLGGLELRAKALAALGRDDEAIRAYRSLIERGPAADLHGELAKLLTRAGQTASAQREIDAGLTLAVETADRFPAERRHLIGFLADHDASEAVRLATLDLESRQDVFSHAWLAWALLQNGEPSAALAAIGPALTEGTQDSWLQYQAGAIHAANGLDTEAISFLTAALDANPIFDVEHAPRASALLSELTTR